MAFVVQSERGIRSLEIIELAFRCKMLFQLISGSFSLKSKIHEVIPHDGFEKECCSAVVGSNKGVFNRAHEVGEREWPGQILA